MTPEEIGAAMARLMDDIRAKRISPAEGHKLVREVQVAVNDAALALTGRTQRRKGARRLA